MTQAIQSTPTGKELTAAARQNLVENLTKVRSEAWAEYIETSRQAWNEFQAVTRAAREEYLMVRQSDRDELRRELSMIEDEFEKSWRTALHEYKADTFGDFRGLTSPAFEEHVPESVIELHPWHREIVISQPSEHRYMVVSHPHGHTEIISYPYEHREIISYPWHIEEVVFHPWHRERSWARYKRAEQDAANECRHLRRATAHEYLLREREAWVRYQNFRRTIWSHYRKIVQAAFEKYQAKYAAAREEVLRSY